MVKTVGLGRPSIGGGDVIVLVDFSSVRPSARSASDVLDALLATRDIVLGSVADLADEQYVQDLDVRLYGGFFAHDGTTTEQYSALLRNIGKVGGLFGRFRVRPNIVKALACRPAAIIVGTYRGGRQRMVDQMLAQDLRTLVQNFRLAMVITDDEDLFPAILAAAVESKVPIRWVRQRELGRNDAHLEATCVSTLTSVSWE